MGIAGILLSLLLLMLLASAGVNLVVLAPLLALMAAAFEPGTPFLATFTQVFMPALARFIAAYFPLFALGAVFGRLLDDTGCTATIAGRIVAVLGIVPSNPLVSEAVCVNLLAGITGSASGGLTIAMEALGATYLERGIAAGISPDLLHRVAAMSSSGLDTLPHNGFVITLLLVCGMTHRTSYLDIFVVSVVGPIVATAAVVLLGSFFPGLALGG